MRARRAAVSALVLGTLFLLRSSLYVGTDPPEEFNIDSAGVAASDTKFLPTIAPHASSGIVRGFAELSLCDEGAPAYSSVRCNDEGPNTFVGEERLYGFTIYNRSCLFENIVFNRSLGRFVFYAPNDSVRLPPVTLSSRAFDLPAVNPAKRAKVYRKMKASHAWSPLVHVGPIPCGTPKDGRSLAYYSPIVAPWNYAHTLFCDLFGLFWAMWEFGLTSTEWQVVAFGRHYRHDFPLPNKSYKAFGMFSRLPPVYETVSLPTAVFPRLLCGIGTKTWSWVTPEYRASGSPELWFAFRRHLIQTAGAVDRIATHATLSEALRVPKRAASRRPRVSICHKKDKRGIVNYDETVAALRTSFPDAEFVLDSAVGKEPREQVQMMLDADVYVCNEGTLGTTFFLMPPGSAFLSIPLVYHQPHLHQVNMSPPDTWWRLPDPLRPDPRKNSGGNIDWFPPAIPWIKVIWYDYMPLNETRIQLPLSGLRNYMPEMNIIVTAHRIVPLARQALDWVASDGPVVLSENYGINADLCRRLLRRSPHWTRAFNSGKCYYGMSWLCEFWTNTVHRWRFLHPKWQVSNGHCGDRFTSPAVVGLRDIREERPMSEFLYYDRQALTKAYTTTDMGPGFKATEDELDAVFPPASSTLRTES